MNLIKKIWKLIFGKPKSDITVRAVHRYGENYVLCIVENGIHTETIPVRTDEFNIRARAIEVFKERHNLNKANENNQI